MTYELQGFRLTEGEHALVVRRDGAGWYLHDEDCWEYVPDDDLESLLDAIDRAVLSESTAGLPEVLAERSLELLGELALRLDLRG